MQASQKFALGALGAVVVLTGALWALALWPAPDRIPEWLARARVACFGSSPSGLPDAAGWMVLTLQPALMFTILLAGWKKELSEALHHLTRFTFGRATLALSAAALIGGLAAAGFRIANGTAPPQTQGTLFDLEYPKLEREAPSLELVDQQGRRLNLRELLGRPVIVTFAYAHCNTVCPLIVRNAIQAKREYQALQPALVVVTLDPERDTPQRLPAIARSWSLERDEYLLSGAVDEVLATLEAWGVPRSRDPRTGEIAHPALTFLLDRQGRIAYAVNGAAFDFGKLLQKL